VRKFSDNLCDNPTVKRRKRRISVTIEPSLEEKLFVLANFGPWRNCSVVVDDALTLFFESKDVKDVLIHAYREWSKSA